MDPDALRAAAALCRMVDAPDLLAWLELPPEVDGDHARAALEQRRRRMQSMQANPKFKDSARFLIKNYRRIEAVLADVGAYLEALAAERASSQVPLLELVIDGVLADGVITPEEAAFVRDQAMRLGIAENLYERILRERCEARGVPLPEGPYAPTLPPHLVLEATTGNFRLPLRTLSVAHRATGTGWWDDAFTRLLLLQVPKETERLVDLSAGVAWAALALLPARPAAEYLGVDEDDMHVRVARRNLEQAGLAARARVHKADPDALPLPDGAVDCVISVMSLQGVPDTRPRFQQARRILRPGGRFVAVEPDCLAQTFWLDRPLPEVDATFRELAVRVDEVLQDASRADHPLGHGGIAIGPTLPARMRAAGLSPDTVVIHPVQVAQQSTASGFARRLRRRIDALRETAGLAETDTAVLAAHDAVNRAEAAHGEGNVGTGVHLLPLFAVVGFAD
ncbi:MAG: class I SAM-dependent methyltransferase [Myxococcota bacterium]